jgi:hypothetical protein
MPGESMRTDADRLALLQEWQASGRSAIEFAEAIGVRVWTLYAWRRKLMPECVSPRRSAAAHDDAQARFAEVVVAPGSHTAHPTSIEILLEDVVIRVPSGCGSSDVAAIVHAVRSAGRIAC